MSNIPLRDRAWPAPTPQEQIEIAEQQAHDDGECEGMPYCGYCQAQWEEYNRDELDRQGYYDSKGRWTT